MLKTVWLTEKSDIENGSAMLLGGFDGLHVGHRSLLAASKKSGLPVGIMTIVGGKEERSLFTFSERETIFKTCGADFVFELPFSEIKDLTPLRFVELLKKEFSPKLFVCGEDFRFGAGASGTSESLKEMGQVRVEVLPLVEIDGEKVGSGTIKKYVLSGEVERANVLLGQPFFLSGTVVKDRQIGRTLGFPTANIFYPHEKCPLKKGVYETRISVDGRLYKGITNYGSRPTFNENTVLTETYLDGFNGDLYGKMLTVEFMRYLRDIQKFDGINLLKTQLQEDIRRVREND